MTPSQQSDAMADRTAIKFRITVQCGEKCAIATCDDKQEVVTYEECEQNTAYARRLAIHRLAGRIIAEQQQGQGGPIKDVFTKR